MDIFLLFLLLFSALVGHFIRYSRARVCVCVYNNSFFPRRANNKPQNYKGMVSLLKLLVTAFYNGARTHFALLHSHYIIIYRFNENCFLLKLKYNIFLYN